MILAAALLIAAASEDARLVEAAKALDGGRIEQARLMVGEAISDGVQGEMLERLIADLAAAQERHSEALVRYQSLLRVRPTDARLLERAAVSAWELGHRDVASAYAGRATRLPNATWQAWNIVAICADTEGDWQIADRAYARAIALAPGRAELLNNQGWSYSLRGDWEAALATFELAFAANPLLPRLLDNLDFARAGLAEELPRRRPGERADEWAARLNDAGIAAHMRGDSSRAVAAFTLVIEVRGTWFERAHNNLQKVGRPSDEAR